MIRRSLRTISGETLAGLTLGVTVFCMVLGSASMHGVVGPGRKLRWAALLALATVALVLVMRDRRIAPVIDVRLQQASVLAMWLVALAAVSATWSVDPRLTVGRAGALGLVFITAAALAFGARTRPLLPARLLQGILAAAVAATVGGLLALAFFHGAVQKATVQNPARFQGLGENPDTVSMLCGLAFAIGLWALLRARALPARLFASGSLVLFAGTIAASGSRGGILAALVGGTLFALGHPAPLRQRLSIALLVIVALAGVTAATRIPKPLKYVATTVPGGATTTLGTQPQLPPPGTPVGTTETQYDGRLVDELYRYQPGPRSLLQSSGRIEAWRQAIGQADARPALGYGFGSENQVFINRSSNFNGSYAENSLIGLYLQLGAIGLASFVALLAVVGLAAVSAVRSSAVEAPGRALAAVFTAGLGLMLIQSYAYSAGNIVMVAFWVCGFTATSMMMRAVRPATELQKPGAVARPKRRVVLAATAALVLLGALAVAGRWESRRNANIQNDRMAAVFTKATSDGLVSRRLWRYRLATVFDCVSYKPAGEPTATNGLELCFWPNGRLVETIDRSSGTPHFASLLERPALSTLRVPIPRLLQVFAAAGAFKDPRWAGLSPQHLSQLPVGFTDIGAFHYYSPKKKK